MAYVARSTFCVGLFLHVILIDIAVHSTQADVIDNCVNISTCIGTYGDIYNALASDKNSFNIESALYPAKRPSSVRVFVNLYGQNGPNKTDNSTSEVIKYTWSLNCLYAAFPAVFLEVWSLGSILVTDLTQELNITIPHFCCNVSVKDRKNIIESVLAALQDLAVIPSKRDPRLNSAECVIEGHISDIDATGRGVYLRVVLCCSLLCTVMLSPILFFMALDYLNQHSSKEEDCVLCSANVEQSCCCKDFCPKREKPLIRSVTFLCCFLFLTFVIEVAVCCLVVLSSSENSTKGNFPFYVIPTFIALECFVISVILQCCKCCEGLMVNSFLSRLSLIVSINLLLYHLYWVAIGIMINPTWGLSVLLIISFAFVALFYSIYEICDIDKCKSILCIQRASIVTAGFFGLCFAVIGPVLAGRSFYGRETADDVMKTALLSLIGTVWLLYWKSRKPSPNTSQCAEAAKKAAAAATAVAEKVTVPREAGTGVSSAVAAAAAAASAAAAAAAAAAEAVAVAVATAEAAGNSNTAAHPAPDEEGVQTTLM
ncbi:uncharacterized protein [Montipora foliosa]